MKDTYTIKGKSGQERKDGKKTGGKAYHLAIPAEEALRLVTLVMDSSDGKLAQMLFAYGLTSDAQEEVGYEIPGALPWTEGIEVPVKEWTSQDTDKYAEALVTYANLPREGGVSVEARQKAWDAKKATLVANGLTDEAVIASILGKRPVAKA